MILRLETENDFYEVENLTREAFWKNYWEEGATICNEHLLVNRLRGCASFVPQLNFVAEINGKIAGHIIYTKSKIINDAGEEFEMLTFGPLSVLPEYRGRGIGKELMRRTFDEARRMGFRAVIIFGLPDYYPRVGFRRCAEFGITTADGETFDPFMVYLLYENALDGISGKYFIDPVYESLNEKDTFEFDKKFPKKNLHVLPQIEILLSRLQPAARAAIKKLQLASLAMLVTKSQREISALPGINDDAIETIRAVMRENGLTWGSGNA
jgi:predicted N-acetyltransferase YhbS